MASGRWQRTGSLRVWRQRTVISGKYCDLIHLLSLDEPKTSNLLNEIRKTTRGTFIDIGAHIGEYSVPFAKHGWRVIAIEPSNETFALLSQNVSSNRVARSVILKKAAVSTTNGFASFYLSSSHSGEDSLIPKTDSPPSKVPTISLESLLDEVEEAAVAKMDIEGAESAILKATNARSIRRVRTWVIEVRSGTSDVVSSVMQSLGYRSHIIEELVRGSGVYNVIFSS